MDKDLKGNFDATPYLGPGIHENCELSNVEYGVSEKGNEFLAFYFKNTSGSQVSKTEWPVREPDLSKAENEEDRKNMQSAYESIVTNQMARIKHICVDSGIVDNDAFTFEADTFKDFAQAVVKLLGDNYKGKKIRIKVVYDRNNFTSLPSYTRYVWIEPMSISSEDSKMRILGIDKMQRTQPDTEQDNPNPFDNSTKSGSDGDDKNDLPF